MTYNAVRTTLRGLRAGAEALCESFTGDYRFPGNGVIITGDRGRYEISLLRRTKVLSAGGREKRGVFSVGRIYRRQGTEFILRLIKVLCLKSSAE